MLLWQRKTTTKQPYDPDPYKVTQMVGTQVTGERRGKQRIRNIEKWKVVKPRPDYLIPKGQIFMKTKQLKTSTTT